MPETKPDGAAELDRILDEGGPLAEAIQKRLSRKLTFVRRNRASVELDRVLEENGAPAKAILRHFSTPTGRVALYRFRTGRRGPDLATAITFRKLSKGRIKEEWWLLPVTGAKGRELDRSVRG